MDGIDVAAEDEPQNGIVIHGDWDNRRIYFKFPYRNNIKEKSVEPFIQDLIDDGIAESGD